MNFTLNDYSNNSNYDSNMKSFATIISISTSCFSLLGCSFIIFLYVAFQKLQQFHFKLVCLLSISVLINTIGNLIVTSEKDLSINHNYCIMQSFFINFGALSSIAWTFVICYYIKNLMKENAAYEIKNCISLFIGYGIPFILSFL